jgi:hypothetical protein
MRIGETRLELSVPRRAGPDVRAVPWLAAAVGLSLAANVHLLRHPRGARPAALAVADDGPTAGAKEPPAPRRAPDGSAAPGGPGGRVADRPRARGPAAGGAAGQGLFELGAPNPVAQAAVRPYVDAVFDCAAFRLPDAGAEELARLRCSGRPPDFTLECRDLACKLTVLATPSTDRGWSDRMAWETGLLTRARRFSLLGRFPRPDSAEGESVQEVPVYFLLRNRQGAPDQALVARLRTTR